MAPERIATQINDKIDMMMFELDNEDCSKRLLPPTENQLFHFSRKIVEASSTMKRPVGIQLGISPFSFPQKRREHNSGMVANTNQMESNSASRPKKEYVFQEQFHERSKFITSLMTMNTSPNMRHSPSLEKLIDDVFSYVETCPDQTAYSDDLRKLVVKLKA